MPLLRFTVTLMTGLLVSSALAEDWPRWRGPRGDGPGRAPPRPDRWPAGGPRRIWSRPLGGGFAGLTVAGGRLFAFDREPSAPAAPDAPDGFERVLCLDAAEGKPLWE